jgi:hypothetical protein
MYLDHEHRFVEHDALPILNSPHSYVHNSLKLTQSTSNNAKASQRAQLINNSSPNSQIHDHPLMFSTVDAATTPITKFFASILEDSNNITHDPLNARIGSHLTRVPSHLCVRNSYHVIIVILDETSGYQLRASMDPALAKKWLRDFIVVATLARMQAVIQREISTRGIGASWELHYHRLLPFLSQYERDPSLIEQYKALSVNTQLNASLVLSPGDGDKINGSNRTGVDGKNPKQIGEVLPDHILTLLQQKQREFIALMKLQNEKDNSLLSLDKVKAGYQLTQEGLYNYEENYPKNDNNKAKTRPIQPTIQPNTPRTRQPPATNAKAFFDSLKKDKDGKGNAEAKKIDLSAQSIQVEPPSYLITHSNKASISEIIMGVIVLAIALIYLYLRSIPK